MMKRYLFATQIIEHSAHSLLIRVDNGLFLNSGPIWAHVKWTCLLLIHFLTEVVFYSVSYKRGGNNLAIRTCLEIIEVKVWDKQTDRVMNSLTLDEALLCSSRAVIISCLSRYDKRASPLYLWYPLWGIISQSME